MIVRMTSGASWPSAFLPGIRLEASFSEDTRAYLLTCAYTLRSTLHWFEVLSHRVTS
jgi:hypothetical protein